MNSYTSNARTGKLKPSLRVIPSPSVTMYTHVATRESLVVFIASTVGYFVIDIHHE